MKLYIYLLSLLTLFSCSEGISKRGNEVESEKADTNQLKRSAYKTRFQDNADSTAALPSVKSKRQIQSPPININEVKALDFVYLTSSTLSKQKLKYACEADAGLYGQYYLINKHNSTEDEPYFGVLKVHMPDNSKIWRADAKNEEFKALKLLRNDIPVWDSIFVGTDSVYLHSFLKGYYAKEEADMQLFVVGRYDAKFLIKNATVDEIEIVKRCND